MVDVYSLNVQAHVDRIDTNKLLVWESDSETDDEDVEMSEAAAGGAGRWRRPVSRESSKKDE